jgi:hypothetical protein
MHHDQNVARNQRINSSQIEAVEQNHIQIIQYTNY